MLDVHFDPFERRLVCFGRTLSAPRTLGYNQIQSAGTDGDSAVWEDSHLVYRILCLLVEETDPVFVDGMRNDALSIISWPPGDCR